MIALFNRRLDRQLTPPSPPPKGIVTKILVDERRLRVKFDSTEWFAQSDQTLLVSPGDSVRIIGRINATTLLVEMDA